MRRNYRKTQSVVTQMPGVPPDQNIRRKEKTINLVEGELGINEVEVIPLCHAIRQVSEIRGLSQAHGGLSDEQMHKPTFRGPVAGEKTLTFQAELELPRAMSGWMTTWPPGVRGPIVAAGRAGAKGLWSRALNRARSSRMCRNL